MTSGVIRPRVAKQRPDLLRCLRDYGRRVERNESTGFEKVAKDAGELLTRSDISTLCRLRQLPWLLRINEPIRRTHELPEGTDPMVKREPLHRRLALSARRLPLSRKGRNCRRTRCWCLRTERATRHCRCAVHQVAKIIRKLGVIATDDRVPAHLTITVKWHLAQRNEARTIRAERRNGAIRIKEVAAALTHPLTAREQPAVYPDALRRLKPRTPEHRRPEDGVESIDVLADDVQVGWPPRCTLRIRWEAGASEIVDERVVPDIDRSSGWIAAAVCVERAAPILANRERDPPGCTLTANRKVF